jgi:hypothetical protein
MPHAESRPVPLRVWWGIWLTQPCFQPFALAPAACCFVSHGARKSSVDCLMKYEQRGRKSKKPASAHMPTLCQRCANALPTLCQRCANTLCQHAVPTRCANAVPTLSATRRIMAVWQTARCARSDGTKRTAAGRGWFMTGGAFHTQCRWWVLLSHRPRSDHASSLVPHSATSSGLLQCSVSRIYVHQILRDFIFHIYICIYTVRHSHII